MKTFSEFLNENLDESLDSSKFDSVYTESERKIIFDMIKNKLYKSTNNLKFKSIPNNYFVKFFKSNVGTPDLKPINTIFKNENGIYFISLWNFPKQDNKNYYYHTLFYNFKTGEIVDDRVEDKDDTFYKWLLTTHLVSSKKKTAFLVSGLKLQYYTNESETLKVNVDFNSPSNKKKFINSLNDNGIDVKFKKGEYSEIAIISGKSKKQIISVLKPLGYSEEEFF